MTLAEKKTWRENVRCPVIELLQKIDMLLGFNRLDRHLTTLTYCTRSVVLHFLRYIVHDSVTLDGRVIWPANVSCRHWSRREMFG